jgi:hypothetical protein
MFHFADTVKQQPRAVLKIVQVFFTVVRFEDRIHQYDGHAKVMRAYPKVSGLAAWRKNCKWDSYLPLDAVVSLFCESV